MTSSTAYRGDHPYSARRRGQDWGSVRSLIGRVLRNIISAFVARALVELEDRTSRSQLKGTIRIRKTGTLRLAAAQSIGRSELDGYNLGSVFAAAVVPAFRRRGNAVDVVALIRKKAHVAAVAARSATATARRVTRRFRASVRS